MGLFGKKKEEEKVVQKLPSLPKLPELPSMYKGVDISYNEESELVKSKEELLPKLPKTEEIEPKNRIKKAIGGENDFSDEEFEETPQFPTIPEARFFKDETIRQKAYPVYEQYKQPKQVLTTSVKSSEPVFVRIDRFQDALKAFEDMKKKINEIEKFLGEIKSTRDKEEREIQDWETEISNIKQKIEKVELEVFSKV